MVTTVTKRISGAITENTTKRVGSSGLDTATYDAWGDSWGSSWGDSWFVVLSLSQLGHTARVGESAAINITKRVTGV